MSKAAIGRIALVVAILVAAAGAFYLLRVKREVARTITPIPVAAPDFYPADTLLFVAMHGVDKDWESLDAWRRRIEPTATWHAAKRAFDAASESGDLDPKAVDALAEFERAMDAAEKRLGSRPTTKEFFDTYGRYTAFGLVPAPAAPAAAPGGAATPPAATPPKILGVVRLPEGGVDALLEKRLGGVAEVKRHDPPSLHGYPVFAEEPGEGRRLFYGLGGGYLFLTDDAVVLDGALGRLDASAKGETAAAPSLATDAVFRRGVPESWNDLRLALFVRKGQQFERFDPALKTVDSVLAHAFRLAPAEPAVCVSAVGAPGTNYAIRASFGAQSRGGKPWEELLPSDACDVYVGRGVTSEAKRKAFGAAYERVRGKELWKEIDALGKDAPRLKLLLRETLGPEMVPSDETLARLPHDVALFGAIGGGILEAAWFAPEAEYAVCQKIYRGSSTTIQAAFGADTDAFGLLVAAMAAETAVEHSGGWVLHDEAPGVHSWRVDVNKAVEAAGALFPPDTSSMLEEFWTPYAPSIVTGKGCIFIVLGEDMRKELVAILSGGGAGTLAADPLWREAVAAVDAGASTLHFSRPVETGRALVESYRGAIDTFMGAAELEPGPESDHVKAVAEALLGTVDDAISWSGVRATISAGYTDDARPGLDLVLMDPVREKAGPPVTVEEAPARAPGVLPASTFLYGSGRFQARPYLEKVSEAFLKRYPGGREKWKEFRGEAGIEEKDLEGVIDALIVDLKGESGVALAVPTVPEPGESPLGTQELIDRVPAPVLWAEHADPERAFNAASELFEKAAKTFTSGPPGFAERKRLFDRGRGSRPLEVRLEPADCAGGGAAAALRFTFPEGPRGRNLVVTAGLVRRGTLLFFTPSGPVFDHLRTAADGGPGTLAERLKAVLPAGTLPERSTGVTIVRVDGVAECLALYFDVLALQGPGLTLMGYGEEPPPPERVQAHVEGWRKALDLLEDALKTSCWDVGATVREGDKYRTVHKRVRGN